MTLGTLSLADITLNQDPLDNVAVVGISCPSLDQLNGVVNANDPCQAANVSPAGSGSAACYPPNFVGPLPPGAGYCAQPAGMPLTTAKSTIIAGVPDIAVYTLGGILLGFVFMGIKK